jgi:hypothetical protein
VRFFVLTAARMKMAVFWDVTSYSLVDIDRLSEVLTASIIRAMMEAANTSKTSGNF